MRGQNKVRRKKSGQPRPKKVESITLAATAVDSAIYDWDIERNSVSWSDGITYVFGYSLNQIQPTDQWWIERIHPDDKERVLDEISIDLTKARNFTVEYRFQAADGKYRNVMDKGLLIRNTEGKVVRVVGSLADVTEHKKGEQKLRESEKQYRLLFEHNPAPMWVLDVETLTFLAVNKAAVQKYGYSREEFLGMRTVDIRPPEDVPELLEYMNRFQDPETESERKIWRHRKKNGSVIDVEIFSQRLMFEGRMARLVMCNDVTVRRQAQETLELLTEVTATASEADDIHVMISRCLEKICNIRNWQLGQAWFVDEDQNSVFCSHSHYSERNTLDFRQDSLRKRFAPGVDIPGLVWTTGQPVWMNDAPANPNTERGESLRKSGLKSAFAFPIQAEGRLFAIFEFFAEEIRSPDTVFLDAIGKLGSHLAIVFERKREQERIRYQATHDSLTGLPNRILFQDRFAQALAHAHRKGQMLAIFMLDLDNFKTINDTLGHAIGDLLLQALAQRLTKSIREEDTIARMGGDELIVLLPEVGHIEDAAKMAQKILTILQSSFSIEGHELHMTTSIGITIFPHDGENAQTLLKNVDIALYRAKEKGRNNYQLYTPSMTAAALARLSMENNLRRGIERNEFLLFYQPQLDLQNRSFIAVEALLRWQQPEMGLCLPDEFLSLAEETGLIVPIWEWALQTACRQLRTWHEAGLPPLQITMNVPPSQFQLDTLSQTIFRALEKTQLNSRFLELEITETMARKELFTFTLVGELKSLGVGIALDDFGTGYSSLSHLKELPINTIKIDPYFVRGLNSDRTDEVLIKTIISLGHGLNVRVVAKGVETKAQLETLQRLGCDAIQGFAVSRPLAVETVTQLLKSGYHERPG